MLTNSVAAGALAAAYVVLLVLLLNPLLPPTLPVLARLARTFGLFYTIACAVVAYTLMLMRQAIGRELFSPAWISVTVLAWLSTAAAAAGAVVFWLNIRSFQLVLEARMVTALTQAVIVLVAASMLFLIIALMQRYGGLRSTWAAWLVGIAFASMIVPLALRGRGTPAPPAIHPVAAVRAVTATETSRVTVIAIEGGSFELIAAAAAEGRLPNFGRLLDAGATMHLATFRPTSSEAVWAAITTGKLPPKNGIRSAAIHHLDRAHRTSVELLPDFCFAAALFRFDLLEEERQTSAALQAAPLWTALNRAGISIGLVNLPLTQPAPAIDGFVVSDQFGLAGRVDRTQVSPPGLVEEVEAAARSVAGDGTMGATLEAIAERHRGGARMDRVRDAVQRRLQAVHPTQVSIVRFESSDAIGHYFLRYAMPSRFGDVTDLERERYAYVLEAHYAMVDEAIGHAIGELDADDLLLVVSGFGMEPLGPGKRVLERLMGDPEVSGTHEGAPDGFLMAYGGPVARARLLPRGSVVDIAPTMLYFLGLPIGRDMDGFARVDVFRREFTSARPMTFIPSYDR